MESQIVEKGILNYYSPDEIGRHDVVHIAGVGFNLDTIVMTWIAMAIIIVLAFWCTRKLTLKPKGPQLFFEMIMEFILDLIDGTLGKKGRSIFPFVATLFIFILMSNLLGALRAASAPTSGC